MYDMDPRIPKKVIYLDFNNVRSLTSVLCVTYPSISTRHVWLYGGTFDAHVAIMRGSHPAIVISTIMEVSVPSVAAHHTRKAVRMRQHEHCRHFVRPWFVKCQNATCFRNHVKSSKTLNMAHVNIISIKQHVPNNEKKTLVNKSIFNIFLNNSNFILFLTRNLA